jgi:hypothetical protein
VDNVSIVGTPTIINWISSLNREMQVPFVQQTSAWKFPVSKYTSLMKGGVHTLKILKAMEVTKDGVIVTLQLI